MDLRPLDETVTVAPQIDPADMARLAQGGVTTIICNRPDAEVPAHLQAAAMQKAAEEAGIAFVYNPVTMPRLSTQTVEEQADAIDGADGKVLAYCAAGTRSAILWALAMAGRMPTDDILRATAQVGYALDGLREQIDALAQDG
ncbi:TIGR01244 family sulfur transferase [Jannaschia rubra]|uniref:TIGR01244 family sulfur transferase n=1 Tax=Jannaschia rubra TaxID=282197 RepID=UPI0024902B8D|nr:TIGR01244 family sulfur transferase [Jannaschia rubra]